MSTTRRKKHVHKKKLKKYKSKEDGHAEKIQAQWRGYKSRHEYNEQRKAITWLRSCHEEIAKKRLFHPCAPGRSKYFWLVHKLCSLDVSDLAERNLHAGMLKELNAIGLLLEGKKEAKGKKSPHGEVKSKGMLQKFCKLCSIRKGQISKALFTQFMVIMERALLHGIENTEEDALMLNKIFDDVSSGFAGVSAVTFTKMMKQIAINWHPEPDKFLKILWRLITNKEGELAEYEDINFDYCMDHIYLQDYLPPVELEEKLHATQLMKQVHSGPNSITAHVGTTDDKSKQLYRVVNDIRVRSHPRKDATGMQTLHVGEVIEVAGVRGNWMLLSEGGWVLSGETVPIGDRDPPRFKSVLYLEQFSILTSLEHLVIVDDVEEYKWPHPGADVVSRGRLRKGSSVEVIDVQEQYCQIKNGLWLAHDALKPITGVKQTEKYMVEMGSSEVRFAHAKATRRSPKTGFKVHKGDLVHVVEFQDHWALLKGGHWIENVNNGKPLLRKADALRYRVLPHKFAAVRRSADPSAMISDQLLGYAVVEVVDVEGEWLQLKTGDYVQWKKGGETILENVNTLPTQSFRVTDVVRTKLNNFLPLYRERSENSLLRGKLVSDQVVEVIAEVDNWVQLRSGSWAVCNDMDGKGHGHTYLTKDAMVVADLASANKARFRILETVNPGMDKTYRDRSKQSAVVGKVTPGQIVTVEQDIYNWIKIEGGGWLPKANKATALVSEVHEFSEQQLYYFSNNYNLPDGEHPIYSEPKITAKQTGSIKRGQVPAGLATTGDWLQLLDGCWTRFRDPSNGFLFLRQLASFPPKRFMVTNTAELALRDTAPIGDWKSSIISVISSGKIVVVVAEERAAPQAWALLKNGQWGRIVDGSHVTLTNVSESVHNVGRLPNIPEEARMRQQAQNGGRWKKRNAPVTSSKFAPRVQVSKHPPGAATGRRPLHEPLYMSNRQSYLPSSVKGLLPNGTYHDTMYMTLPAHQMSPPRNPNWHGRKAPLRNAARSMYKVMRRSVIPKAVERDQAVPQEEPKFIPRPITPESESDVIADLVKRRKPKQLLELKPNSRTQRPLTVVFPDHSLPVSPDLDLSMLVRSVGHVRPR